MKKQTVCISGMLMLALLGGSCSKEKKVESINDSNTPLHLLQPQYVTPYGVADKESIKKDMDRVLAYLEVETPTEVINKETGEKITDYSTINEKSQLKRGAFRLASYEWGVTYSGMLEMAAATGDERYKQYVYDRFKFISDVVPHFQNVADAAKADGQMRQIIFPKALDDAGAMCAAMIKAEMQDSIGCQPIIYNYMNFIMNDEYRLEDGTFARNRPLHNSLWLDDMFMSIPAIAQMGRLTGDTKYYDEAIKQIEQFSKRMFVKEKGLYMHAWVEGMEPHPAFHWGRANGWAILTKVEVLDVLPENYPGREKVLQLLKDHIKGLAAVQSGEGFWHQLLDRNDSYLETSATAIYTYCIARAINKGWVNALAYGPVAMLGWNAVSSKINDKGQVEGTCVGTGMGFDPAFYYYRPVNVFAAHGYGPVLLAGAEMITLLNKQHPKMNDSAVQFYNKEIKTDKPIFSVDDTSIYID